MTARYVELVRVSTAHQVEHETPENQRRALDALATRRPGERIARLEALATSGAKAIADSEAGRELERLADEGFDELRLWNLDRGLGVRAEDPIDRLALLSLVRRAGAVLVDATGKVIDPGEMVSELEYYLRSLFAAEERKRITERTAAGKERLAAAGKFTGGTLPYGFTYDREAEAFGHDAARAAFVRELFERSIHEASDAITRAVNLRDDVPPTQFAKGPGRWRRRAIVEMVRNPAYKGALRHHGHVIQVPPIVDAALWNRANAALDARRKGKRKRKSKRASAITRGLVTCPCGRPMYHRQGKLRAYFYCQSVHSRSKTLHLEPCEWSQQKKSQRAEDVDATVWSALIDALDDPAILRATIAGDTDVSGYREEAERCESKLAQLTKAEVEVSKAYRRGHLSVDAWQETLRGIASDREILERTLAVARDTIESAAAAVASFEDIEAQLDTLREEAKRANHEGRRALVDAVFGAPSSSITVYPDRVEVTGRIPMPDGAAVPFRHAVTRKAG